MEQLQNNAREAKKIAMKSLRKSLSEVLQVSLEEHILDNILGHLNLLDEEADEYWRLETAEEEISGLSSLYHHLSEVYSEMKEGLFSGGTLKPLDFEFWNDVNETTGDPVRAQDRCQR